MLIKGQCHCENIRYDLSWPEDTAPIPVRECGCTFCAKHAGAWTSNRAARLVAEIRDPTQLSPYTFGTHSAEFYVCARCGVVPFVVSEIDGALHAVVNVNTFETPDVGRLARSATDFDAEDTASRLDRRKRNWIPDVRIAMTGD